MNKSRAHFPELCVWLKLSQEICRGRRLRKITSFIQLLHGGQETSLNCDQEPLSLISEYFYLKIIKEHFAILPFSEFSNVLFFHSPSSPVDCLSFFVGRSPSDCILTYISPTLYHWESCFIQTIVHLCHRITTVHLFVGSEMACDLKTYNTHMQNLVKKKIKQNTKRPKYL